MLVLRLPILMARTRSTWWIMVSSGMAVLLAIQLRTAAPSGEQPPPLLPGASLTIDVDGLDSLSSWPDGDCFLLYVMDPSCVGCAALAAAWSQSAPADISVRWLFSAERLSEVESFVREYGLERSSTLLLGSRQDPISTREAGFVATPTRIVFGSQRKALDVRVTQAIPGSSEIRKYCGDL